MSVKIKLYLYLLKKSGLKKALVSTVDQAVSMPKYTTNWNASNYAKPTLDVLGLHGTQKLEIQVVTFARTTH